MTTAEVKSTAIAKLASLGVHMPANITLEKLSDIIGLATGSPRPYYTRIGDFVEAFAYPPKAKSSQFNVMVRKAFSWRLTGNPRADRLDSDQPPMLTPNGTGNWNQFSQFMMDNEGVR